MTGRQLGEKQKQKTKLLPDLLFQGAPGKFLPTFRVGLPASHNLIGKIPHRCVQQLAPELFPIPVKMTAPQVVISPLLKVRGNKRITPLFTG